jgi:hypothetical protein
MCWCAEELSGQLHSPADLTLGKSPADAHSVRSRMGPGGGLRRADGRKTRCISRELNHDLSVVLEHSQYTF